VTGLDMPAFPKRRLQHGATARPNDLFPSRPAEYRRIYQRVYEAAGPVVGG
jgi:asparagine synthase (glutamine-hydrolysing)